MRGRQDPQVTLLAFIDLETRVPSDHPLRVVKRLADQALKALSPGLGPDVRQCGPAVDPARAVTLFGDLHVQAGTGCQDGGGGSSSRTGRGTGEEGGRKINRAPVHALKLQVCGPKAASNNIGLRRSAAGSI